jgi:short-chain fatty acids transporter
MLARLSARLAAFAQKFVPDPFVIALGLTVVATIMGLVAMQRPDVGLLAEGWFARFSAPGTLTFTFQMAWMLVAGTTLAAAPAVHGLLGRLADVPKTTRSAVALTSFVAMSAALLNWGFGLVAGAVLAQQIGLRARAAKRPLNYPLVGAAGYTGMMVWHGGFSGSAPLKVAEAGPLDGVPVPLDGTILSPLNIGLSLALLAFVPWLLTRMAHPSEDKLVTVVPLPVDASDGASNGGSNGATDGPIDDGEHFPRTGRVLMLAVVALGVLALVRQMLADGVLRGITLNSVNLMLVLAGLLLFGTPLRYARTFTASVTEAGGILLQFPFYFGILGVLEASGLVTALAESSADMAQLLARAGLPLGFAFDAVTFFSAGLVNLFVPSGGGQWAVQGTIVAAAAADLSLPLPRAVMALSYGDEWTNMLQPFWALALLGITGLKARDILGYTLTVMLAALPLYLAALFWL